MSRVYFIRPIGMAGPIKIGCSCAPDNRRKTLETWSPFPLEIVAEIDGDMALERRFHAKFRNSHIGHEWFELTRELEATIAQINANSFDLGCLPEPERITHFKPRDNSYSTLAWRYQRSVDARLQAMMRRGASWQDFEIERRQIREVEVRSAATPEQVEAAKLVIEPIIARLQARFPRGQHRRAA